MSLNTGKYLEAIIHDELNKNVSSDFLWRRLYDTTSAQMKVIQAQPADFLCCHSGRAFHIEAKTTKHKLGRLPKASFSQCAAMKAWSRCGFKGFLLVHTYGFDGEIYLVDVDEVNPELKSWVIPDIGKPVLVTNLLQEMIELL